MDAGVPRSDRLEVAHEWHHELVAPSRAMLLPLRVSLHLPPAVPARR
jgi:hypothetical protein